MTLRSCRFKSGLRHQLRLSSSRSSLRYLGRPAGHRRDAAEKVSRRCDGAGSMLPAQPSAPIKVELLAELAQISRPACRPPPGRGGEMSRRCGGVECMHSTQPSAPIFDVDGGVEDSGFRPNIKRDVTGFTTAVKIAKNRDFFADSIDRARANN